MKYTNYKTNQFFAEMVKTDHHMAMVKDWLLFEKKKIDAVEQRKSNKEQKFRLKKSCANQLAKKLRKRKQSIMESQNWAYKENNRNSTNKFTIKKNHNSSGGRRLHWINKDGKKQTGWLLICPFLLSLLAWMILFGNLILNNCNFGNLPIILNTIDDWMDVQ